MKRLPYALLAALIVLLGSASSAYAVSTLVVPQGGTGKGTFSASQLLYGNGTAALSSVATTTVSCSGSASCTSFVAIGSSPITISATGGAGGSGTVGTSTNETSGFLPYWTTTSATPALLGKVATTTLAGTGPISISNTPVVIGGSGAVVSCATATGSIPGCLSAADFTTFNGKQAAGNYITALTGDVSASGPGSAATTLATVNGNVGSFTNANITVNAKGLITSAANGTGGSGTGLATSSPIAGSNVLTYSAAGAGSAYGTATSSIGAGTGLTFSGAAGAQLGGTNGTYSVNTTQNITTLSNLTSNGAVLTSGGTGALSIYAGTSCTNQFVRSLSGSIAATCATVANTDLANSTISGVALGGTLAALTATDATLTFSGSYTGATARTIGLNLTNPNTWTGLQQFSNASSTQFSAASNTFYVDGTGHTQAKDTVNAWSGVLSPTRSFALQTGTTTAWTGTTTGGYIPFVVVPFAGTLRTVRCKTDTGTLGTQIQINGVDTGPGFLTASTTVGKTSFTSANTFSAGDKIAMINGTPASTPTTLSCTFAVTETP